LSAVRSDATRSSTARGRTERGRPLRLGIDAHVIGDRKTGNERFMTNMLEALRPLTRHELVLYFTHPEAAEPWRGLERTSVRIIRPNHPLVRVPVSLALLAARDRLDALLVQYTAPPVVNCPVVTVVHDVAFAVYPEFSRPIERVWITRTVPFTMRRAAGIVTVSEFSRDEIVRVFGLPLERITVAYDGVGPPFTSAAARPSPLEPPFFLTVGNLQPRKNLATLVRAYRIATTRRPDLLERLVIVGQEKFASEDLDRETADLRSAGRVAFTGYIGDDELIGLLQKATAFAYPSVYEGFGLPPVEAMAVGTPAAVSDIPVTEEVCGDAALRVPPTDPEAWADALLQLASDGSLRERLATAGRERAAMFTWERCARSVLQALVRAAEGRRKPRQ
jgi:glycosyltransferase involved in cell wall biosynthesis